ncbi:MAG: hypothetical protein AAFZ65_03350 [Planctomycetota bacterium]
MADDDTNSSAASTRPGAPASSGRVVGADRMMELSPTPQPGRPASADLGPPGRERASAVAWLIGAGATGYAAARVVVERPNLAGSLIAVALLLVALGALALSRHGRGGPPPHPTLAGALAALSIAFLAVLGPVAATAPVEESAPSEPWPLPEDPELAAEALRLRAELRAAGASDEELRQVLEAIVEDEQAGRQRRAELRQVELERERNAALAADRERRDRKAAEDDLRALIAMDQTLVLAGRLKSIDSGPLADRPRWVEAERRLGALDPRAGLLEATRAERAAILEDLIESLDARTEGLDDELGSAIAAIESRLASTVE